MLIEGAEDSERHGLNAGFDGQFRLSLSET